MTGLEISRKASLGHDAVPAGASAGRPGLSRRAAARCRRALLAIAVLALAASATDVDAAIVDVSRRWPQDAAGLTIMKICIIDGSSTDQGGAPFHSTPSLAQVVARVRNAVNNSWARYSSIRFEGWAPCSAVGNTSEYVGLYIYPDADNNAYLGTRGKGHVTAADPGIQFAAWGKEFNSCVSFFDGFDFACAEQYAVHEFGHALGFVHEWLHPLRPASCPQNSSTIPSYSTTYPPPPGVNYILVNPSSYDYESIMTYWDGCVNQTGVRFGSTVSDPTDIQALIEVYGPPVGSFSSNETDWAQGIADTYTISSFNTDAANVQRANEVTLAPIRNAQLGSPLTFRATTAGVCGSFTLDALQPGAGITFDDDEFGVPGYPGSLSIGDISDYEDDNFELTFPPATVYAVGFYLVDNTFDPGEKVLVYGETGLLGECGGPGDPNCVVIPQESGLGAFIGFSSTTPITSVYFEEGSGDDDIAIRDIRLGCGPVEQIAYPDLPAAPIAVNEVATTCANPLVRTITVPDDFVIADVDFGINLNHTYRGDIQVSLQSPAGTTVTAIQARGDGLDNYDVLLDDSASGSVQGTTTDLISAPYFDRAARPDGLLSAFVGQHAAGNWLVRICDAAAQDSGAYNRGVLILEPASPIVVTSALDTVNPNDGVTTLREAMTIANLVSGTITFHPSLTGATITHTTGGLPGPSALVVEGAVVIDGADAPRLTITQNGSLRLFRVMGGLTLRNLILSGGQNLIGGAVAVEYGTLSVESSTIAGNSANFGGGISNFSGSATITNSTISGNDAIEYGGGIFSYAGAVTQIQSSTIVANTGSGGGIQVVATSGPMLLENSIVAGNASGDLVGSPVDAASHHNLVGTPASAGGLVHGVNSNIVGNGVGGALPIAAILEPTLADNGGPTSTHMLLSTSPARDSGLTDLTLDQRGISRPQGSADDIGSVEFPVFAVSNTNDSGQGSLRQMIADASAGTVITFPLSMSGQTIALTSGQLLIDKNLTIDASSLPEAPTVSASSIASRVLEISSGKTVSLTGLTFHGGSKDYGAGIRNNGNLTLTDCTVDANDASVQGGGIYNYFGSLTLRNVTVSGNFAGSGGGGIWSAGAPLLRLENTTVSGNQAPYHAGVSNENGTAIVIHSTFSGNIATAVGGFGGGFSQLQFGSATLTFESNIAAGNSAAFGPDVYRNSGTFTPTGVNLIGNNGSVSIEFPASALHGTVASPLVLLLGPLRNNGGPTDTLSPLLGSPAIDTAILTANTPATDQNGVTRPFGVGGDVGAIEYRGDGDGDGVSDGVDNCPHYATQVLTDTNGNGRGDECECGDQDPNGLVNVSDLVAINVAIFTPALATPLCDANNDGLCNVSDIVATNVEIFSPGTTSTCGRQRLPGP